VEGGLEPLDWRENKWSGRGRREGEWLLSQDERGQGREGMEREGGKGRARLYFFLC
jgi:hypothetical protein